MGGLIFNLLFFMMLQHKFADSTHVSLYNVMNRSHWTWNTNQTIPTYLILNCAWHIINLIWTSLRCNCVQVKYFTEVTEYMFWNRSWTSPNYTFTCVCVHMCTCHTSNMYMDNNMCHKFTSKIKTQCGDLRWIYKEQSVKWILLRQ